MKKKLLALALLAGGSMFAETRFSFGVNIGSPAYYAPAPVRIVRPPYPGSGYVWVDAHWTATRFGRMWVPGHWSRPVAPRYGYYNNYSRNYDRNDGYGYRNR